MATAGRDQVAACWLATFGNGGKFVFTVGAVSMVNVVARISRNDFLGKVFVTHVQTNRCCDLVTLCVHPWTAVRTKPLQVWMPPDDARFEFSER